MLSLQSFLLATRTDFSINILRTPGLLFQEQGNDKISNIYDISIVNKTFKDLPIDLKLENISGDLKLIGREMDLKPQEIYDGKILIIIPGSELKTMNTPVTIGFYSNGKLLQNIQTSFLGPMKKEFDKEHDKEHEEKDEH